MKKLSYFLLAALVFVFSALPAFAAEAIATTHASFGALLTYLIPIFAVILGALGLLLAKYLLRKIGLEGIIKDDVLKAQIDKLADEAAAYGVAKAGSGKWTTVETKNKVLGFAINYANDHGPEMLEKAGFDSTKIKQKLEAKINSYDPTTPNPVVAK